MSLADVLDKTNIDPAFGPDETVIRNALQTAYDGSALARQMLEGWIGGGNSLLFITAPGKFEGVDKTGVMNLDFSFIQNFYYLNGSGQPVPYTPLAAVMHELSHAIKGLDDLHNTTQLPDLPSGDFMGDNVRFVNGIYAELGIPQNISYSGEAWSFGNTPSSVPNIRHYDLLKPGYSYTNGAPINGAVVADASIRTDGTNDLLINGPSSSRLHSGGGDDFIFGGGGNDELNGGDGRDVAVYFGSPLDYDIRQMTDGTWQVSNVRGAKDAGTDTLSNVEAVQFDAAGGTHVTYELQKHGLTFQTDFAFVIDTTGSMTPTIASVKRQAATLIDAAFANGNADTRIGVVGFKDTTNREPSTVLLPFTEQADFAARKAAAVAAINAIQVRGGGDLPETDFDGLRLALDGHLGQWRGGAGILRIALFTDAPAKDGALAAQVTALAHNIGATIESHVSTAGASGAVDTFKLALPGAAPGGMPLINFDPPPFTPSGDAVSPDPNTAQVQIFTVYTGPATLDTAALQAIAAANGGKFLTSPANDTLAKTLLEIIKLPSPVLQWSHLASNAVLDFNPASQVLQFDQGSISAADVQVTSGSGGTTVFSYSGKTVTLKVAESALATSNVTFVNGSRLLIGDNSTASTSDDAANSVIGGTGKDHLVGLGGDDTLTGGAGADRLDGGAGFDVASYASAAAAVTAKLGAPAGNTGDASGDTYVSIEGLTGSQFNDVLAGDDKANTLTGLNGNDRVLGLGGNDTLSGGSGDDTLEGGVGADRLDGGEGFDVASYASAARAVTARLDTPAANTGDAAGDSYLSIEGLVGSRFGDTLVGNADANDLAGMDGNDLLRGRDGSDTLRGGNGNDTLRGGAGNDRLYGEAGNDELWGGRGDDTLYYSAGLDRFDGGTGSDTADFSAFGKGIYVDLGSHGADAWELVIKSSKHGGKDGHGHDEDRYDAGRKLAYLDGIENLKGTSQTDYLSGDGNANRIDGGGGADVLRGGGGADTFHFGALGSGVDTVVDFKKGAHGDHIDLHDVLVDYHAGVSSPSAFIRLSQMHGDTTVSVNADGIGADFVAMVVLEDVGGLQLASLIANGNLVL